MYTDQRPCNSDLLAVKSGKRNLKKKTDPWRQKLKRGGFHP